MGDLIVSVPARDEQDAQARLGTVREVLLRAAQPLLLRGELAQ
jgi:hypothetical protein